MPGQLEVGNGQKISTVLTTSVENNIGIVCPLVTRCIPCEPLVPITHGLYKQIGERALEFRNRQVSFYHEVDNPRASSRSRSSSTRRKEIPNDPSRKKTPMPNRLSTPRLTQKQKPSPSPQSRETTDSEDDRPLTDSAAEFKRKNIHEKSVRKRRKAQPPPRRARARKGESHPPSPSAAVPTTPPIKTPVERQPSSPKTKPSPQHDNVRSLKHHLSPLSTST